MLITPLRTFLVARLAPALFAVSVMAAVRGSALASDAGPDPAPASVPHAVVFLWYADGGPAPVESACAGKTPPGYTCSFAADIDGCKRAVQAYLDRWYADLNVVFTYTKPTEGQFFTVIVTSTGGDWCNPKYDQHVGGVAPISCNRVLGNGTCYAFQCGRDAKTCATIIAQEQAHLVGLEHTTSPADAMYVYVSTASDGFEDRENPIVNSVCNGITQNSFQTMRRRLGDWPGGPKNNPYGPIVNGTLPLTTYTGELQGSALGCALDGGAADAPVSIIVALALALAALRTRWRSQAARPAQPAQPARSARPARR